MERFFIATGRGNGLFTLRQLDRYSHDGEPTHSHVKSLSRDPAVALQKAQAHIESAGYDPKSDLESFDPKNARDLTAWGECDPEQQQRIRLIERGVMPYGKHFGQRFDDIPVEYFANWYFDGDIDSERSDIVKERIRLQVICRRDDFMAVVEANKAAQAQREAEVEAKRSKSNHVGEVGQRILIETTITFSKGFEGFYGTTFINSLEDAEGNVFIYRGNCIGEKGDKLTLKATVKEHGEYDGVRQTVISRPKVLESAQPCAA